jgi:murein DD-endopeptidase MepM/ murein hydrolase activator NlpD
VWQDFGDDNERPRVRAPLGLRGPSATRMIWIAGGAAALGGIALWWVFGRRRPWSGWIAPVANAFYRDGWGADRGDHIHEGLDFFVEEGTPVRAVAAGTVISTNDDGSGGAGKMMIVDHGSGFFTRYMHLSEFIIYGGHVNQGDVIALSGKTGITSSAAHLHFDVRVTDAGLAAYREVFDDPAGGYVKHGEQWAVPAEPLGPWQPEVVA